MIPLGADSATDRLESQRTSLMSVTAKQILSPIATLLDPTDKGRSRLWVRETSQARVLRLTSSDDPILCRANIQNHLHRQTEQPRANMSD